MVLRSVFQNCRGVPFKGLRRLGRSRLKGCVQRSGGPGRKGGLQGIGEPWQATPSHGLGPRGPHSPCAPGQRTPYDVQITLDAQETTRFKQHPPSLRAQEKMEIRVDGRGHSTTGAVVLRTVLQNCRGVPFKGPRSLGGSRLKGPSKNRGVQGGRGAAGGR